MTVQMPAVLNSIMLMKAVCSNIKDMLINKIVFFTRQLVVLQVISVIFQERKKERVDKWSQSGTFLVGAKKKVSTLVIHFSLYLKEIKVSESMVLDLTFGRPFCARIKMNKQK